MAHTNGTNGNQAIERAAESVWLRGWARLMMAYGLPAFATIIVGGGVWMAERLIRSSDELTRAVYEIRGQLAPIISDQGVMKQQIEQNRGALGSLEKRVEAHVGRHDTTDKRLDGLDARNRDQDGQIREIERRVWRNLPDNGVPRSAEPFEPYPPARR